MAGGVVAAGGAGGEARGLLSPTLLLLLVCRRIVNRYSIVRISSFWQAISAA